MTTTTKDAISISSRGFDLTGSPHGSYLSMHIPKSTKVDMTRITEYFFGRVKKELDPDVWWKAKVSHVSRVRSGEIDTEITFSVGGDVKQYETGVYPWAVDFLESVYNGTRRIIKADNPPAPIEKRS